MNRIAQAFAGGKAFIAFLTAGDPSLEKSCEYILEMERAGADLVEIGIPFSDPIAEGPVIQAANIRALAAHTDLRAMFKLVEMVREKSRIPLVFMTYINPVFKYGTDAFFAKCAEIGVDGVIIPDMPFEERRECAAAAVENGVSLISMIAPTSKGRIKAIAGAGDGFMYIVSSLGVTGTRSEIKTNLHEILEEVRSVTTVPAAVGFGINTPEQAVTIAGMADGVIVGSAVVKIIAEYGSEAGPHIYEYVKVMKEAIAKAD